MNLISPKLASKFAQKNNLTKNGQERESHATHPPSLSQLHLYQQIKALLPALIFLMLQPDGTKALGKLFSMSQMNHWGGFQESTSVGITSSFLIVDVSHLMDIYPEFL